MPRNIAPIRAQAPDAVPSILTVARSEGLDAAWQVDPEVGWNIGVQFRDTDAITSDGLPAVCVPADAVVPTGDDEWVDEIGAPQNAETRSFFPWTFYVNVGCSIVQPGENYDEIAIAALAADSARAISREVWDGYWTGGHCLMRDAVDLTPGGAVELPLGMGLILEAVAGAGTWHVPTVLEPELRKLGLHIDNGNVPRGPGGWPISFGPGYGRGGPVSSPWRVDTRQPLGYVGATHSSTVAAATEAWIVGHAGRIEVAWRDVPLASLQGRPNQWINRDTNAVEALRERRAIFRYNPGKVYAAHVKFSS